MSVYKELLEAAQEGRATLQDLDANPFMDPTPAILHLDKAITGILDAIAKRQRRDITPHKDQLLLSATFPRLTMFIPSPIDTLTAENKEKPSPAGPTDRTPTPCGGYIDWSLGTDVCSICGNRCYEDAELFKPRPPEPANRVACGDKSRRR